MNFAIPIFLIIKRFYTQITEISLTSAQSVIPKSVGITNASAAHFIPPVSFLIVRSVVEQGKCIRVKIITQSAVTGVQPFAVNSSNICDGAISASTPCCIYIITISGITISFAGSPSKNAVTMTPSKPINRPNGSKKSVIWLRTDVSPIEMFARTQIITPAGAATAAALPRTKTVLSRSDRTSIFPICGFLNGGSSSVNEDGSPFRIVAERIFDAKNVASIPRIITAVSAAADKRLPSKPIAPPMKNSEITFKIIGNLPLHGTKLFVSIAIRRSRRLSIIRAPTTPAALQPKPIVMD